MRSRLPGLLLIYSEEHESKIFGAELICVFAFFHNINKSPDANLSEQNAGETSSLSEVLQPKVARA